MKNAGKLIIVFIFLGLIIALLQYAASLDGINLDRDSHALVIEDSAGAALGITGLGGTGYNIDRAVKTTVGGISNNTVFDTDLYATIYVDVTRARFRTLIILPSDANWELEVWLGSESVIFTGTGAVDNLQKELGPLFIPKGDLADIAVRVDIVGYSGTLQAYEFESKISFDFEGAGEGSLFFDIADMPYPRHCFVDSSDGTL